MSGRTRTVARTALQALAITALGSTLVVTMASGAARAGCWCGSWYDVPATFNLCFRSAGSGCSDGTWASPAQQPLADWNEFDDIWRVASNPVDSISQADGLQSASFLSPAAVAQRWGYDPDPSVLAVTLGPAVAVDGNSLCPLPAGLECPYYGIDDAADVDIVVLNNHFWSSDEDAVYEDHHVSGDGTLYHFGQVLAHEFGHAMGLFHEGRYASVMNPTTLTYRGVVLTGDDVNSARQHYPSRATTHSDLAISAYGFTSGVYSDVSVGPSVVNAGSNDLEVTGFSVFNRSGSARQVDLEIQVDGDAGWTGSCDLAAYRSCVGRDVAYVSVPNVAYSRSAEVVVVADDGAGHRASRWLGDVLILAPVDQDNDSDGYTPGDGDCDDASWWVHPFASETCNDIDDDCDGGTDEAPMPVETCNYRDDDCDGLTDEGVLNACGYCGAVPTEVCNHADDDCDGETDEGVLNACGACGAVPADVCNGLDDDCDGTTDAVRLTHQPLTRACYDGPTNTVWVGRCDYGTATCADAAYGACVGAIVPVDETCNNLDDDCDGATDEGVKNACGGCGPVPTETCNHHDDDCDGETDEGTLNACGTCGVLSEVCNGFDDDCDGETDEGTLNVCKRCGAVPTEKCNKIDDDCDGETDEAPLPAEICNGVDDDCDGLTDEGVANLCGKCGALPAEWCNGVDDDCDGKTDEFVTNRCGTCGALPVEACNGIDDDCNGKTDEGLLNACGACGPLPVETCNGIDDDCDGSTDRYPDGRPLDSMCHAVEPTTAMVGVCRPGVAECVDGAWGACLNEVTPSDEVCNGLDDDCDGVTDEGVCAPDPEAEGLAELGPEPTSEDGPEPGPTAEPAQAESEPVTTAGGKSGCEAAEGSEGFAWLGVVGIALLWIQARTRRA